ncbi:flavin monoamine oxidase family protein [Skermania piniformis]|uniref:flavin monoamine oxidase family protein n=1 Tax=Skermania pinensis TaxID=39122 RepID=UPI000A514870|nr:FAD-dependent oxidoreductase [Skermania piniformis]
MTGTESATVVVVGAGMSGLIAARALHRGGIDVIVLDAADRVGGRMSAETSVLGSRLDLGGQWVGHGHHRFEALAAELGTTLFPMNTPRLPEVIRGQRRIAASSLPLFAANVVLLRWELAARRKRNPSTWTSGSVRDWLDRRVRSGTTRRALEVMVTTTTCADPDVYPMAAFGDMIRYQAGLIGMVRTKGGAQERLVVEGAGTLTDRLAAELGPRVRTAQRVTELHYDTDGVWVRTPDRVVRADLVVVTVPPPMAASITFTPPLPAARAQLIENTHMGTVYKAIAVYERPFWRDRRKHAEVILLDEPGAVVFDTSPPNGPGHLCLLVAGPEARTLDSLSSAQRRQQLLGRLAGRLGADVDRPVGWHEKSWHLDRYVGGGYSVLPNPGTAAGRTLPVPHDRVGPIHWAGTETAAEHAGYIEGAIESGQRVAEEVRVALGRT